MKVIFNNSTLVFGTHSVINYLYSAENLISGYLYPTANRSASISKVEPNIVSVVLASTSESFDGTISYIFSANDVFNCSGKKFVIKVSGLPQNSKHCFVFPTKKEDGSWASQYRSISFQTDGIYTHVFTAEEFSVNFGSLKIGIDSNNNSYPFSGIVNVTVEMYLVDKDEIIE